MFLNKGFGKIFDFAKRIKNDKESLRILSFGGIEGQDEGRQRRKSFGRPSSREGRPSRVPLACEEAQGSKCPFYKRWHKVLLNWGCRGLSPL